MTEDLLKIVIVGGGLTGLSAAFYVRKMYREAGLNPQITILEKNRVMGGVIQSLRRDGFIIEKGPDSFLARKTAITDLIKELNLENELVTANPDAEKTYILHRGELHSMPSGLVLGIPTEMVPFLKSGLISPRGKLRALMDFIIPRSRNLEDESVGSFIERRLGSEVLNNITEPLIAGIYAADTYNLSMKSTFPQFAELEREYGSLIRGMISGRKPSETHTGTKKSTFLTLRNGIQCLVDTLVQQLEDVEQYLEMGVSHIHVNEGAVQSSHPRYHVEIDNGQMLDADHVIITTPNYVTAELLRPHLNVKALEAVKYVSVANVAMAFAKSEITSVYDGSGFLVPRKEGRNITACTWTSTKWLHSSPEDHVLLRCYIGRSGDEQNVMLPDEELMKLVMKDMKEIMGITAKPLFTEISRLEKSMPQYPVGHLQGISSLKEELYHTMPGIHITGAGYEGIGLPDCIKQAKEVATRMASTTYA